MKTASEIKNYYDEFSKTVFLRDFQIINLRLQAIKELCDRFIPDGANVLEIGCGAGIISKHLQQRVSHLVAIDISEKAIEMAKLYAADAKSEFKILDITADISALNGFGKFDTILLPDVLEHIPKELQKNLFERIENLLTAQGLLLITFPSPEYQEYLKQNKPELLQAVDETLWLHEILAVTSLKPFYFTYVDAGEKNQYIHLVLRAMIEYSPVVPPISLTQRFIRKIRKTLWQFRNRTFLRKVKHVF